MVAVVLGSSTIRISYPGGGSSDFAARARATNNATGYGSFNVTRKTHYRLAKGRQHRLIEAAETRRRRLVRTARSTSSTAHWRLRRTI